MNLKAQGDKRKESSLFRIEVSVKDGFTDPRAEALQKDIHDLGISAVKHIRVSNIYLLEGNIRKAELKIIGQELLTDPIVEQFSYKENPHLLMRISSK